MQFGRAFGFEIRDGHAGNVDEQFLCVVEMIAADDKIGFGSACTPRGMTWLSVGVEAYETHARTNDIHAGNDLR